MCGKNLLTKGGNYTVCMTEIKSQSSNQDAFCNELSDQDFCFYNILVKNQGSLKIKIK